MHLNYGINVKVTTSICFAAAAVERHILYTQTQRHSVLKVSIKLHSSFNVIINKNNHKEEVIS